MSIRSGGRHRGGVAVRVAVAALLMLAAAAGGLLGVAMISWAFTDRPTRYGYTLPEALGAPASGLGLLVLALGVGGLAANVLDARPRWWLAVPPGKWIVVYVLVGLALFLTGRAIAWDPYLVGTG